MHGLRNLSRFSPCDRLTLNQPIGGVSAHDPMTPQVITFKSNIWSDLSGIADSSRLCLRSQFNQIVVTTITRFCNNEIPLKKEASRREKANMGKAPGSLAVFRPQTPFPFPHTHNLSILNFWKLSSPKSGKCYPCSPDVVFLLIKAEPTPFRRHFSSIGNTPYNTSS